jgi:NAD(P)-dependent dehydrogenase (short-subunit alcohol dehydrogenase family)
MLREKFDLTGRIALVTGAARGIGKGYADALAEFGANIAVGDINEEGAERAAKDIASQWKVETLSVPMDVTSTESVQKAIGTVVKHFGKLDIGVNNAGIASTEAGESITDEVWNRLMDINLKGVFVCCREEAKAMMKTGGGKIINTASMSASIVNTPQKQSHYNTSKAGVVMLTKSLAAEWVEYNIRVNCISPGYILTEMNRRPQVVDLHPAWIERTPMKRLGEVEDLMGAVVYLASDASAYTTGAELICDGGYTLW